MIIIKYLPRLYISHVPKTCKLADISLNVLCYRFLQATNYVLAHQDEDSAGEIQTKLIKVQLLFFFMFCPDFFLNSPFSGKNASKIKLMSRKLKPEMLVLAFNPVCLQSAYQLFALALLVSSYHSYHFEPTLAGAHFGSWKITVLIV